MKLVRFGEKGKEKPGVIDADGRIRDLSGRLSDIGPATVSLASLEELKAIDLAALPIVEGDLRLGACLSSVPNFFCIGLNYAKHAEEAGMAKPAEPILFSKAVTALSGPSDEVIIPKGSEKTDWEVELGVVIGAAVEHVSVADALSAVAGYCVINDVSERAWQTERGGQWIKGKSAPTFGPVGPWLVTADEVADPQALDLWLELNGERVQSSTTADMIFSVAEIISHVSQFMRLQPGDIFATGTPAGVGMGLKPPRFLRPGDTMRLGVTGLCEQHQTVVAWPG